MRYGFLFGAGAEIAYKLPSGGRFALDIFREDQTAPKEFFKGMRDNVDPSTNYASQWLPKDYQTKSINTFGKSVFQNIIMSTVEHRRKQIVNNVNSLDNASLRIVKSLKAQDVDVNKAFFDLLKRDISNVHMDQIIAFNEAFHQGNKLFENTYFSGLLMVYRDTNDPQKQTLGKYLLAIMQLQLGALSEDLSRNINDNLFSKKDERIDILDDFGELIQLNYNATGVSGLELLLDKQVHDKSTPFGIILHFAYLLIEDIYAGVLDYKALIDSNWHYLYNPSSDWAKFCKITIFLLTVRQYIANLGGKVEKDNPDGYYNMLSKCINKHAYDISAIATTNYNKFIEEILGPSNPITYLNGSISDWYDPYLNKVGTFEELDTSEHHIVVPLLFTQSGTKPMTSISMSVKYVALYKKWKESDAIVVVGFGFGPDDEHINGIIRTLVNDDQKKLIVVTLNENKSEETIVREIAIKLKIQDYQRITVLFVNRDGRHNGKTWAECL